MESHLMTFAGKPARESNGNAKMDCAKVAELRLLRAQGETYRALGRHFGIDHKTARKIALGLAWKPDEALITVSRATNAELGQVADLLASGLPIRAVAARVGVTTSSVQALMRPHGLQSSHVGTPGYCINGHARTAGNRTKSRGCRVCANIQAKEYQRKKRAKEKCASSR